MVQPEARPRLGAREPGRWPDLELSPAFLVRQSSALAAAERRAFKPAMPMAAATTRAANAQAARALHRKMMAVAGVAPLMADVLGVRLLLWRSSSSWPTGVDEARGPLLHETDPALQALPPRRNYWHSV